MNKILKAILLLVCAGGIYIISLKCYTEFSFYAVIDQELEDRVPRHLDVMI